MHLSLAKYENYEIIQVEKLLNIIKLKHLSYSLDYSGFSLSIVSI